MPCTPVAVSGRVPPAVGIHIHRELWCTFVERSNDTVDDQKKELPFDGAR